MGTLAAPHRRRAARGPVSTRHRLGAVVLVACLGTVTPAGCPAAAIAATAQPARPSDSFVNSVCVATHWGFWDTPYGQQYTAARDKLLNAGIRFDRDQTTDPTAISRMQDMAARGGIKFILGIDGGLGI